MKFTEYDTGLGTSYERLSLYSLLERLAEELQVRTSLEGPIDGITGVNGINSIALARRGVQTTVVLPKIELIRYAQEFFKSESCLENVKFVCSSDLPLRAGYDLVWNFNCLPQISDYERVLDEMAERSRRYILVFVSNTLNYGFWVHRLHHVVEKEPWYHGNIHIMNTSRIGRLLEQRGFRTVRRLFVDVPWWPDIDSPIEEVASSFFPFLKRFLKKSRRLEIYKYNHINLPYFHSERREALLRILRRHPNFESSRIPLSKHLFAHHQGVLAEKAA